MDRSQSKSRRYHQAYNDDDLQVLSRTVTILVVAIWAAAAVLLFTVFCL